MFENQIILIKTFNFEAALEWIPQLGNCNRIIASVARPITVMRTATFVVLWANKYNTTFILKKWKFIKLCSIIKRSRLNLRLSPLGMIVPESRPGIKHYSQSGTSQHQIPKKTELQNVLQYRPGFSFFLCFLYWTTNPLLRWKSCMFRDVPYIIWHWRVQGRPYSVLFFGTENGRPRTGRDDRDYTKRTERKTGDKRTTINPLKA